MEIVAPLSSLGDAISALDEFTGEERDIFFASLDQLPHFDDAASALPAETEQFEIEEEDWKWLATQVGTRTQQELAQLARNEYDRMVMEDPDLVRCPPLLRSVKERLAPWGCAATTPRRSGLACEAYGAARPRSLRSSCDHSAPPFCAPRVPRPPYRAPFAVGSRNAPTSPPAPAPRAVALTVR
jgi:hypothetical protein